jgi:hypothetical protein
MEAAEHQPLCLTVSQKPHAMRVFRPYIKKSQEKYVARATVAQRLIMNEC